MKVLCLLSLALASLFAQNDGSSVIDFNSGIVDNMYGTDRFGGKHLVSNIKYTWQITRAANGDKTFNFVAYGCIYEVKLFSNGDGFLPLPIFPTCAVLSQSVAEVVGPIDAGLTLFNSLAPGEVAHTIVYGPFAKPDHPLVSTAPPVVPPNPQMIMLDGLGNSLLKFDLTNFAVLSQVVVPSTSGPLGVRPTATGDAHEVWVASGGAGVSVADLGALSVIATIPTPSIPTAVAPAGIVFTNSGATALYAVAYYSPDSAGNNGALLVFDAVNQKVTSTLPLKYAPTALLMSPDGITAYLLSGSGMITYYDVFSGTADFSTSTYTPGLAGGYPGASGSVFIHPDGTRLFWNVGVGLTVFDLTTHRIVNQFSSGLPTTSAASIRMSQDGSTIWFANALGNVVILDTRYGNILETYQTSPGSAVYPGPSY